MFIFIIFISSFSCGQAPTVLVFDLMPGKVDSFPNIFIDTTIHKELLERSLFKKQQTKHLY
jgi:hypothetical protein